MLPILVILHQPGLTFIGRTKQLTFGKLHSWYDYESLCISLLVDIRYKWKLTCRECFVDNLEYDWLMMMSLDGAVISLYHVTL